MSTEINQTCLICYTDTSEEEIGKTVGIPILFELLEVPVLVDLQNSAIHLCSGCAARVDTLKSLVAQLTDLIGEIQLIRQTLTNDLNHDMHENRFSEINTLRQLILAQVEASRVEVAAPDQVPAVRDFTYEQNELQPMLFEVKEEAEIAHDWDDHEDDPDWNPVADHQSYSDEDPLSTPVDAAWNIQKAAGDLVAKTKKCSIVLEKIDGGPLRRSTRKRKSSAKRKKYNDSNSGNGSDDDGEGDTSKKTRNPGLRAHRLKKLLKRSRVRENKHSLNGDVKIETNISVLNDEEKLDSASPRPHPCQYENCTKSFNRTRTLEIHVKRVHEGCEFPYSCTLCESSFQVLSQLVSHRKDKHPHAKCEKVDCPDCGKTLTGIYSLKSHMNNKERACKKLILPCGSIVDATSDKKFVCGVCSHRLRTRFALDLHCRRHTGQKRFICEYCSTGFNQSMYLKHHQAAHHPEEVGVVETGAEQDGKTNPYQCPICNKVYGSPQSLKLHELIHTQEYPLNCSICGLGVTNQQKLKLHMVVHSSERSFACDQCTRTFKRVDKLRRHITTVHKADRPFLCSYCPKTFADRYGHQRHLKIMHEKDEIKPFSCLPCGQHFALKDYLNVHEKTKKHKEVIKLKRQEGKDDLNPDDEGEEEVIDMMIGE